MLQYLVFVGAIISLVFGVLPYIKDTLKGKTKPNRVTWLIWAIAPLIATFAAIADGVGWSVVPVFMAGFGSLLIFAVSFVNKNSYWKLEIFDYFCGFCSLLALAFWAITKEPVVAIVLAIVSDGFATVPTLMKSWKHPETETLNAYTAPLFGILTGFTAIKTWNFSSLAFPIYLLIISILIIFAILRPKMTKKFK